jgi:hypothetical protein
MERTMTRRASHLICAVAICFLVGCSAAPSGPPVDPSERNLRLIWTAWFASKKPPQKAPRSWEDIARFIDDDDPKSVRYSPHDHQAYVIRWEAATPNAQNATTDASGKAMPITFPILAHEQLGRDGKRLAVNVMGQVQTLTEEQFKQAVRVGGQSRANHKPPAARSSAS